MIEWAEWEEAESATRWDSALVELRNHNPFQAYGWGEYKRRAGWTPKRGSVLIDGTPVAMAQCLTRQIGLVRVAVAWVPGGPAGERVALLRLGETLRRRYAGWALLVRANVVAERSPADDIDMAAAGWVRPDVRVGHPLTFCLDLDASDDARRKALGASWRHNLRRGEQRGGRIVTWGAQDALESVYAIYRETAQRKRLSHIMSLDDVRALREAFGPCFTLAAAIDEDGAPMAMRGFIRLGSRAHDVIAGVSSGGRRRYANYALTWRLLELAKEQGVDVYDMGGADPDQARGVYEFKKGLGGRAVPLVGEWEWTTARWLRWAFNRALSYREGSVHPD